MPIERDIVIFCQTFYPDSISTSQLLTDLCVRLAREGARITVYCGHPARSDSDLPREETHQGVRIRRLGLKVALKKSLWHRLASYASYLAGSFISMLRLPRGARVLGVTNPPFLLNLLWLASLLRGFEFDYMLQDIYPEGLARVGKLGERSIVYRLWSWCNKKGYDRARRLVVLGRDMAELLVNGYGQARDKIVYIPHWSPHAPALPPDFEDNPMAAELGLAGSFVVQYSGNMGLWHDIDTLVEAAGLLADEPGLRFLFIGDGMRRRAAESLAARRGLENIVWLDYQPRERLSVSLTCCHVALISLRGGCEGVAVPCKLYGIMASARAILAQAPADSEIGLAVAESGCGLVVPPGDARALADAVRRLAGDRQAVRQMGRLAFEEYGRKYTLDQGAAHFARLFGLDGKQ